MKNPYAIIFFGVLAILMGIGKDKTELIPSELKLTIGIILIVYGIYLIYKPSTKNTETENVTKKNKKSKPFCLFVHWSFINKIT